MQHRIFIAINLPENIKKEFSDYQKRLPDFPIRWTKQGNMHITVVFIGYVKDEDIPKIWEAVKQAGARHKSFEINLNKICYGPPKKLPPRMIWAKGELSKELINLKSDLEESLIDTGLCFATENRELSPHITLGRIRAWEWKRIEPEERPDMTEEILLDFKVNSIQIMESKLKRSGAEYNTLLSVKLK